MTLPQIHCNHTCKEVCRAIEIALQHAKDVILQYGILRDECTYPEVKTMLNELIIRQQQSIRLLEDTKVLLKNRFEVLDQIREGFEM